jgi:hypothetical protein
VKDKGKEAVWTWCPLSEQVFQRKKAAKNKIAKKDLNKVNDCEKQNHPHPHPVSLIYISLKCFSFINFFAVSYSLKTLRSNAFC